MLNTVTDYSSRIALGKEQEAYIIDYLNHNGYKIELPTTKQDKYDKIDGFICPKAGGRLSFQLKFREAGSDIIFEAVKDWEAGIDGRDMISRAQLYVIVNPQGILSFYNTAAIKTKAKELVALADANPVNQTGDKWEMKFTTDKASGNHKLMMFFNPSLFPTIATIKIKNYTR